MKNIFKKGMLAVSASLLLIAASGTAHAIVTAGGASIHNAATLTFTGGTVTASVDVSVNTIATAPTITVDSVAQSVNGGQNATYIYTVRNNANGADTFTFAANSADVGVAGVPTLNVNGTATNATSLILGGSITTAANTVANTIVIPAGSEVNFAANDTINIGGNLYTINVGGIAAGTPASTAGAVTTPEVNTVITVTPVGAAPVIAVGAIVAGTQVGEQQTFTTVVTASTPAALGTNGTHTVNLTGATTAVTQGVGGAVVAYATGAGATSTGSNNQTITTVLSPNVALVKQVRNLTQGGALGPFGATASGQSGDVLEYKLVATEGTGLGNATGASLADTVPVFTTYVPLSTTLNGAAVADGALSTLPLIGGMAVNSPAAAAGTIAANGSATVTFQVTID